jgi:hypothetical protein
MSSDPNNPERLISVPSELEAGAIVVALADRGIEATLTGDFTAGFRAEAPGEVHVMVRHKDLNLAKQALARMREEPADIEWSDVDVGEPES